MSSGENVNDLFEAGLLLRLQRYLGLVKRTESEVTRRILLGILIGWFPLAVLSITQFLFLSGESLTSFFYDFSVYARFLVAVPALIFAETECVPRLGTIANHFAAAGLVAEADKERYRAAISSTRRLHTSRLWDLAVVVSSYAAVAVVALYFSSDVIIAWRSPESGSVPWRSPAGWWYVLVSLPLLLIILFGWLWRVVLWGRFLLLMSCLDLRLIPSHPDRIGGLKFVTTSILGFRFVSFGLGAVAAGSLLNFQVHRDLALSDVRNVAIGLIVFLLVMVAGPLIVLVRKIRQTKKGGVFAYGGLALAVGMQFEEKWLSSTSRVDQASLTFPDFSATTDLYSVAANAYAMRDVPFGVKDLVGPIVIASMLPFLPLAVMAMPFTEIVQRLVKLVF